MISVSLWIMVYRGKGTAIASHVITTDSPNTTFPGVEVKLITVGGTASVKIRLPNSLYLHWSDFTLFSNKSPKLIYHLQYIQQIFEKRC